MNILQRALPPIALLEWGGIITYFCLSGRVASFLHPNFRGFALITGILLIGTALLVAFTHEDDCGRETHDHDGCCGHDHDEHEHGHGSLSGGKMLAFAIILLPMGLAAFISPDRFSAEMVEKRGTVENASSLPGVVDRYQNDPQNDDAASAAAKADQENPYLKPNSEGNIEAEVLDLMYAAEDPVTQKDYNGKRVEMIGQFVRNASSPPGTKTFKLMRLFMICCATDVQPLSVAVETKDELPDFPSMSWVKVVGDVEFTSDGAKHSAKIKAERVTTAEAPVEQYIY